LDARVEPAHDEAEGVALIFGRRLGERSEARIDLRSDGRTNADFSFASSDFKVLDAFFCNFQAALWGPAEFKTYNFSINVNFLPPRGAGAPDE
jgi:hypothetical protein